MNITRVLATLSLGLLFACGRKRDEGSQHSTIYEEESNDMFPSRTEKDIGVSPWRVTGGGDGVLRVVGREREHVERLFLR